MIKELQVENFKMLKWLDEHLDGHKGFVCGGCFKNIFSHEKVKDIDIFFRSEADWQDAVYWFDSKTSGYNFDGYEITEDEATYIFYYENSKVKAYKHKATGVVVELCRTVFGEPAEILRKFDFTITKFAYYREEVAEGDTEEELDIHIETKLICHEQYFEHLMLHRLVLDDEILFPMSTLERTLRYAKYGYFPCKESKLKLARALHDLSEDEIIVSESLYDGMD